MDLNSIIQLLAQMAVAAFMAYLIYGAYLIVNDSSIRFEAKYGKRWFVNRADKEKLDAQWDRLTREQQLERIQRVLKKSNGS